MKLIYLGGGFLPGVPGRDLDEGEIAALGLDATALLASGLYAAEQPTGKPGKAGKEQ